MSIIKRLVPEKIKKGLYNYYAAKMRGYRTAQNAKIPKIEFEEKHVANAKLLSNRLELLRRMPKNSIVAEVGVFKGDFSKSILDITQPRQLYLVDAWASDRYNESLITVIKDKLKSEIDKKIVHIRRGFSTEVVAQFEDTYFDWIYIDTDHSYVTTLEELNLYSKKVKPGGIIAGHDYIIGNWNKGSKYGVIEAVHEFCVNNNWEVIYLTAEIAGNPSFAIRRINSNSL